MFLIYFLLRSYKRTFKMGAHSNSTSQISQRNLMCFLDQSYFAADATFSK